MVALARRALLVAVPFAVGLARVYLLDHYASDVIGSVVLGVVLIAALVVASPRTTSG